MTHTLFYFTGTYADKNEHVLGAILLHGNVPAYN